MLFVPQTSNLFLNISYSLVFLKMCYIMWLWCHRNITHVIKIYHIRKDGGGGGSKQLLKKKLTSCQNFPFHHPLVLLNLFLGWGNSHTLTPLSHHLSRSRDFIMKLSTLPEAKAKMQTVGEPELMKTQIMMVFLTTLQLSNPHITANIWNVFICTIAYDSQTIPIHSIYIEPGPNYHLNLPHYCSQAPSYFGDLGT